MTLGNAWRLYRGLMPNGFSCFVHRKHCATEGVAVQILISRELSDIPSPKAGCSEDSCLPTPIFGSQEKEESLPRHRYRSLSFCLSPTEGLRLREALLQRDLPRYLPVLVSAWCLAGRYFPHRSRLLHLRLRRRSPHPRRMSPIQFPRGLLLQPMPEQRHHHPKRSR